MDNFFFGKNKFSKSESNQEFTEISSNYSRTYSKGKSFKFSIWNEVDTYNNDEFVQDFVQWNQKLWAAKKTSTNIPPTQGEYWELIVEGVSDVEFKQEDNRILWKYEDDLEWKDLFELDSVSEEQIKKMLEDLDIKYRNTYDDTLSLTSTNAVQNQAVTKKFKELDEKNTRTDNELTNIKSSVNTALSNSKSYTDSKISETKIQIDSELNKKANQTNIDETVDELNKSINLKVDKVFGKGLSTNDFNDNYKSKLDNLDFSLNSALTSAKSHTNSEITKVDNKIKSEISRAQASETNLSNRIDGLKEDLTNALNEAKEYTDSEIKNNTNKINTLTGTGEGSVVKTVKDEIAKVVDGAPEQFNTLKEISEYLNSHEDVASGLVESITKLETEKLSVSDIDSSLSTTSENPVMNKVITAELSSLGDSVVVNTNTISSLAENKADKDGVYSGMTVGRSIDLLGVEDVEEGSFLFRPTDGDGSIKDGVAVVKSVKGDSVVRNQLYKPRKAIIGTQTYNGVTFIVASDGSVTANGTSTSGTYASSSIELTGQISFLSSHIYMLVAFGAPAGLWGYMGLYFGGIGNLNSLSIIGSEGYKIFSPTNDGQASLILACWGGQTIDCSFRPQFYDLTKMFGVGNEPSTIEEFNARMATLGVDMNAYNEGKVVNMKASAIKSVGFNAWDEQWENGTFNTTTGEDIDGSWVMGQIRSKNLIPILPNEEYYVSVVKSEMWLIFLDKAGNPIESPAYSGTKVGNSINVKTKGKFRTPINAAFTRFYCTGDYGNTYNHDICINLVHSGYRNGEYEPYVEDVLALPTLDLFPNGMNKIGDVYDEYDSEKSVQRIGIRPYQSGDESIENVLTDGTTTIYVLEEPIVTPHDYRLAYKAWDFGTEQVIADGNTTAMTAGITYEFNARDTIRSNKTRLDVLEPIVAGKIDKEADDYYPQLAVGLADNLAGVDVVDSEINFRRSGGGAISDGVARIEAIKGNSVVWNQCAPTERSAGTADNTSGSSIMYKSTNVVIKQYTKNINGHIIYVKVEDAYEDIPYYYFTDTIQKNLLGDLIFTANTTSTTRSTVHAQIPPGINASWDIKVTFVDLTKMFGAGNEPTTIEEFYARIPMGVDLNAYNEGEVIHMDVQSIESQGVNAWDEEWESGHISQGQPIPDSTRIRSKNFIKILPNTSYHSTQRLSFVFYDAEYKYITLDYSQDTTTPSNAMYMKFSYGGSANPITTYKNDICINISDTSINGKYFPYIKRVEDLAVIRKYFPQGMKSAGSAYDEIRYNKETNRWEAVKRIGEVDLGTLTFSSYRSVFISSRISGMNSKLNTKVGLLARYPYCSSNLGSTMLDNAEDKVYCTNGGAVGGGGALTISDSSYTDAASFKAAMSGVILYYELAEPIVTELDAEDQFKDLDYQVWNCGTEKAIAEGKSAPLAADITYGFNAIGKIKELESLVAALRAKVGI